MDITHLEAAHSNEEYVAGLKGKVEAIESKMDRMMLLLAAVLTRKGSEATSGSIKNNEETGSRYKPLVIAETMPTMSTYVGRQEGRVENVHTAAINAQMSASVIVSQQLV